MAAGFLRYLSETKHGAPAPVWTTLALFGGFYLLLLGAILIVGLTAPGLGLAVAASLEATDGTGGFDPVTPLVQLLILLVGFGVPLAALVIWCRLGEQRSLRSLLRVSGQWRPGLGLAAFGLMTVFLIVAVAMVMPGGPEHWLRADFGGATGSAAGLFMLVLLAAGFCVQVGFEELLCRGWLVQRVGWHGAGWLVAGAASAALFTAMHASTTVDPAELARVFILGAAFVYAVARTGGLEAALGAHLGNNLTVGIVLSPAMAQVEMPSAALQLGLPLLQGFLLVGLVELWLRLFPEAPPKPDRG